MKMASIKKFNEKAVVNQIRHIERTIKKNSNSDIDPQKNYLNYRLLTRNVSSYDYFKERKKELYCYKREDIKVLCGWVVTAPKELDSKVEDDFFRSVHEFLIGRYGEENAVDSVVHKDESGQPHLHFLFIPVVPDKKHGGEKICANDVINRKELRNFHPDLQRYLDEKGFNVVVQSGITSTQGGNRSVRDLKNSRQRVRQREIERSRW